MPKLLILDEPTRGIDAGARGDVYRIIQELKSRGLAILMISSDMEELIGMSDRIIVLCKGRMAGTLNKNEISQETILTKAAGAE